MGSKAPLFLLLLLLLVVSVPAQAKDAEFMDSYATILFSKITEINPKEFCKQYGLCRDIALFSGVTSDNTCVFCHHLLDEIVSKLKDPDAEFEIIQILIKECNKIEGHVQQASCLVHLFNIRTFSTCSTCWGMFGLLLKLPSSSQAKFWSPNWCPCSGHQNVLRWPKERATFQNLAWLPKAYVGTKSNLFDPRMVWANISFVLAVQETGPAIHSSHPGEW
ncbi:prosaposin-like [Panicum miliaceum]|uniref:Prosaposin-like n=1 Tax=Panicum miliaceum TaxID=4540 RepID=A0A3L6PK53_PANMI|nr:prosaposin-like [Panicum miliaceum]